MKLTLVEGLDIPEAEIEVRCSRVDPRLSRLLGYIRQYSFSLEGKDGEASYYVPLEKILYVDSIDGKTFLYTAEKVYESRDALAAIFVTEYCCLMVFSRLTGWFPFTIKYILLATAAFTVIWLINYSYFRTVKRLLAEEINRLLETQNGNAPARTV